MDNPFVKYYKPYFKIIDHYFEHLANETIKNGINSDQVTKDYLGVKKRKENFRKLVPEIVSKIETFWHTNNSSILEEYESLGLQTLRYGGDIGPKKWEYIFERTGIYYDSVLIPDPILRIIRIVSQFQRDLDYYLMKYGIEQSLLKNFYLADVYPPIGILVGERELLSKNENPHSELELPTKFLLGQLFSYQFEKDFEEPTE